MYLMSICKYYQKNNLKTTETSSLSQESCKTVKENFGNENFSFEASIEDEVVNAIMNILSNKASISMVFSFYLGLYYPKLTEVMNNLIFLKNF